MILCGVDRSDEAAHAARLAAELAVRVGARLALLHVAPLPWVPTGSPDEYERLQEQESFDRAGYLRTLVDPIRVDPAASVERRVEFGHPVELLRSVAEELGATHLVVGSRGQGAVEEVLLASTSGALVREAPCPVILVPPGSTARFDLSADAVIVCGVDGSDGSLAASRHAAELAERVNGRLVVATVLEDTGDDVPADVIEKVHAAPRVRVDVETLSGRAPDELLALARRREAQLLVVGSRGRGALKAAVLGSVSGRIVQDADRPVMVVSRHS
jgi:nucleotide-binding universal stress UspA family protein